MLGERLLSPAPGRDVDGWKETLRWRSGSVGFLVSFGEVDPLPPCDFDLLLTFWLEDEPERDLTDLEDLNEGVGEAGRLGSMLAIVVITLNCWVDLVVSLETWSAGTDCLPWVLDIGGGSLIAWPNSMACSTSLCSELASARSRVLSVRQSLKLVDLLKASGVGAAGRLKVACVRCSGAAGPARGVISESSESELTAEADCDWEVEVSSPADVETGEHGRGMLLGPWRDRSSPELRETLTGGAVPDEAQMSQFWAGQMQSLTNAE